MIGYVINLRFSTAPRIGVSIECCRDVFIKFNHDFYDRLTSNTTVYKVEFEPEGVLRECAYGYIYRTTKITYLELI